MTQSKHSRGPWKVSKTMEKGMVSVDSTVWGDFARVVVQMEDSDEVEFEGLANLHLITAAPDMYEVIPTLIGIILDNLDGMDPETRAQCEADIATARSAISKANGKHPNC